MSIGKRIRDIRKQRGHTQKYCADKLGIATKSFQAIEANVARPSIDRLSAIANYFGVPVSYLLGEEHVLDATDEILLSIFHTLSDKQKQTLIKIAQSLDTE